MLEVYGTSSSEENGQRNTEKSDIITLKTSFHRRHLGKANSAECLAFLRMSESWRYFEKYPEAPGDKVDLLPEGRGWAPHITVTVHKTTSFFFCSVIKHFISFQKYKLSS